jgi:hypothetical protein
VKSWLRNPAFVLGLVLVWRVLLLVFTAQPIPANDAFGYDGGVVNFLHGGPYCNPSMALVFPISGREVYSTYPPLYQGVLLLWMDVLGASAISAMALHLVLFAISGFLTLAIIRRFFPPAAGYALALLLLFGVTFDDRPEGLAFVFGLASLWFVARQISEESLGAGVAAGLLLTLLLGLFTSVIVGAYFFGAGFLACVFALLPACRSRREEAQTKRGAATAECGIQLEPHVGCYRMHWFAPFIAAALLFAVITLAIAKMEPRWWAGFMESARQQSVLSVGFHAPSVPAILKLVRTVPVFLLGVAALPLLVARRKVILSAKSPWLALALGIFAMGWMLLVLALTLLSPNYVAYAIFTQILLAAALLALSEEYCPQCRRWLRAALLGCVLLVSVRAVGMTTWGALCAWHNSYQNTQKVLQTELQPFVASDQPVLVSSAYLYRAAVMGVKNPIHSDWYFDHAHWTNNAQIDALIRLQPPKLVLTQFDYYRGFAAPDSRIMEQLQQRPELVEIHVRNLSAVPVPDAFPAVQKVVQHISWAPVIVDLKWKR